MKIVFFIQGMKSGGAERVMSVLCNSMADKGHEVILGITETMDDMSYAISEKVQIADTVLDYVGMYHCDNISFSPIM